MKRFIRTSLFLMVVGFAFTAGNALAAYGTMNYQGKLTTAADVAVPDGAYPAQFSLWTDSLVGTQVWLEQQDITVSKGLFTTELGKIVSLSDVFNLYPNTVLYLQVQVTISGSVQTLRPRMAVTSVPHAQLAHRLVSDTASNVGEAIFTSNTLNGSSSLRVLSLNGLPPGEPVMGTLMTADADSATIEVTGVDGGAVVSEYRAKAGKTGATKRMIHNDGGNELSSSEQVDADSISFDQTILDGGSLVSGYTARTGKTGSAKRLVFVSGSSGSASREYADADSAGTEAQAKEGATTVTYSAKAGKTGATKRLIYHEGGDEASSSETADADSVVFVQSLIKGTVEVKYSATQKSGGSAKRESASDGGDSSSSDEFISPDSIVSADTLKENGTTLVLYKATTGKTGKAKQSLRVIPGTGSESETNEFSSADSTVYDETYNVNGQRQALYTAKQGKSGSASGKRLIGGGSSSSSDDINTPDSIVYADSVSGGTQSSAYKATQGKTGKAAKAKVFDDGDESSSEARMTADSIVTADSVSDNTGSLAAYTAKQGKTGSAKQSRIVDDGDESSSEARMTADSIITADSISDNTGSLAAYTAKAGKTGSAKLSKIVDDDDESSSSERMAVDSIVHDESTTVNGVVVTQYTAKQGSSGRTKRTIQNSGGHEYASNEEVDNNGARLYLTHESISTDTGFYADADGNLRISGSLGIGVPSPSNPLQLASGAHCTAGGVFTNASDVNLKENFQPINEADLLDKVEQLPISQWNYKNEGDEITHIGPTAQDFKAIFGVGNNDKSISTIDPAGIALAAIKELRKENRDLKGENAELKKRLDDLQKKVEALISNK